MVSTRRSQQKQADAGQPMSPLKSLSNDPKPRKTRATKATTTTQPKGPKHKVSKSRKAKATRTKRSNDEVEQKLLTEREDECTSSSANLIASDNTLQSPSNPSTSLNAVADVEKLAQVDTGKISFAPTTDAHGQAQESGLSSLPSSSGARTDVVAKQPQVTSFEGRATDAFSHTEFPQQPAQNETSMIWLWAKVPQNAGAGWATNSSPDFAFVIRRDLLEQFLNSLNSEDKRLTTHVVRATSKRKLDADSDDYVDKPDKRYKISTASLSDVEVAFPGNKANNTDTTNEETNDSLVLPDQDSHSSEDEAQLPSNRRSNALSRAKAASSLSAARLTASRAASSIPDSGREANTNISASSQSQKFQSVPPPATPKRGWSAASLFSPFKTPFTRFFGSGRQDTFDFNQPVDAPPPPNEVNIEPEETQIQLPQMQEDVSETSATVSSITPLSIETPKAALVDDADDRDVAEKIKATIESLSPDKRTDSAAVAKAVQEMLNAGVPSGTESLKRKRSPDLKPDNKSDATTETSKKGEAESQMKPRRRGRLCYKAPRNGGYGFRYELNRVGDEYVSDDDSDTSDDDSFQAAEESTARSPKRIRLSENVTTTPGRRLIGRPDQAEPYTGELLKDADANVFTEKTLPTPGASENDSSPGRTFTVPDASSSDDDDDDYEDEDEPSQVQTPSRQPSHKKSVTFADQLTTSSPSTASRSEPTPTQQNLTQIQNKAAPTPPPAPTPAHATLPANFESHDDKVRRSFAQINRYAPKQSSNLKIANRLSSSSVASNSDIGDSDKAFEPATVEVQKPAGILKETSGNEAMVPGLDTDTKVKKVMAMVPDSAFVAPKFSDAVQREISKIRLSDLPEISFKASNQPAFKAKDPAVLEALQENWGPKDDARANDFYKRTFGKFGTSNSNTN